MALFQSAKEAGAVAYQKIASFKTLIFWIFATVWVSWDTFVYGFSVDYFKWRVLGYVSLAILGMGTLELDMPPLKKLSFIGIMTVLQIFLPMIPSVGSASANSIISLAIIVIITYFWTYYVGIYFNRGAAATLGKIAVIALAAIIVTDIVVFAVPAKFPDYQTAVKAQPAMDIAAKGIKSAWSTVLGLPGKAVTTTETAIRKQAGLSYASDVQKTDINKEATIFVDGANIRTESSKVEPYKIYQGELTTLSVPLFVKPFKNPNGEARPFNIIDTYCQGGSTTVRASPSQLITTEPYTARCIFGGQNELSTDVETVQFHLIYNFKTQAILPVFLIGQETSASIKAQNLDPIEYELQKTPDAESIPRKPISTYTLGPAKLGIETDPKYLLEIPPKENQQIYVGMSLEKNPDTAGGLANITEWKLDLPEGLEIDDSSSACGNFRFSKGATANGYTTYTMDNARNQRIERDFVNILCKLNVQDANKLLSRGNFNSGFIGSEVTYDYDLRRDITVEVHRPRTTP